jgi:adenylate kinase family enzyme
MRVLITGASGSGTTTLGRSLAGKLSWSCFDADDYYWLPSDPPFQRKCDPAARVSRFVADLGKVTDAVVSGSIMSWGEELEGSFDLIVFLTVPADIRVARLRQRELQKFGRVDIEFLTWAAQYEDGRLAGRSRQRHERWLADRKCRVLRIDGDTSVEDRVSKILTAGHGYFLRANGS